MNHPASSVLLPKSDAPSLGVVAIGNAGAKIVGPFLSTPMRHTEIYVADTDLRVLSQVGDGQKIQLGSRATDGWGTGSAPELGRKAAEESLNAVVSKLAKSNIVLFVAGLGGGTGTGALPVIASAAQKNGAFTIALVTTPFDFEGRQRQLLADQGILDLKSHTDILIVISNQRLLEIVEHATPLADTLRIVDGAFNSCLKMVGNLVEGERLLDLNFADLRRVVGDAGQVVMAYGEGGGDKRVATAIDALRNGSAFGLEYMENARRVLVHVSGGPDLSVYDVEEAALRIRNMAHREADIRIGASIDHSCKDRVRISVFGMAPTMRAHEAMPSPMAERAVVHSESAEEGPTQKTRADVVDSARATIGGPTTAQAADRKPEGEEENEPTQRTIALKISSTTDDRHEQPAPVTQRPTASAAGEAQKPSIIGVVGLLKGTGKTTLARHLAHQAQLAGEGRSIIVQVESTKGLRPDGTKHRQEIANVPIIESSFEQLPSDIERLRNHKATHIFVDATAGTDEELDNVIANVDAVVIPTRPVEQQVQAVGPIVASAERHGRAFVMIINCASKGGSANARVAMALAQHGVVCPVIIPRSEAIAAAAADDQTAMAMNPHGLEADCFARLWDYLAARLGARRQVEPDQRTENVAGEERRKFRRWDLRWPVKVTIGMHSFDAVIENISGGGVLLKGATHLTVGQGVRLEIENLDTFEAEVVHTKDDCAGLRFLLEGARQYQLAERLALIVERAKNAPSQRLEANTFAHRA